MAMERNERSIQREMVKVRYCDHGIKDGLMALDASRLDAKLMANGKGLCRVFHGGGGVN